MHAKKNKVTTKLSTVKDKILTQKDKLSDLKHLNEYIANKDIHNRNMSYSKTEGGSPEVYSRNSMYKSVYSTNGNLHSMVEEQIQKNKIKHTKEIYSICAYYHEDLSILAIALIDKEVKIYKMKQNAAKIFLEEQHSF